MTDKWHGGKGSKRRKGSDQKAYSDNYDRIFTKKNGQAQQEIDQEKEQLKKEQAQDPKNG